MMISVNHILIIYKLTDSSASFVDNIVVHHLEPLESSALDPTLVSPQDRPHTIDHVKTLDYASPSPLFSETDPETCSGHGKCNSDRGMPTSHLERQLGVSGTKLMEGSSSFSSLGPLMILTSRSLLFISISKPCALQRP